MGCVKGVITQNKPIHTVFKDHLTSALTILKNATLAAELQSAFSTADAALRAKLPNVLRLFETIMNQLNLSSFGFPALAEKKALQYTPPPREKKENLKAPAAPPQPKAENREEPQDRSRR
ncbi:hypothetical protein BC827DRAFT_1374721 [Russula dissimulans]|nr:hypothetical protein BC827DRAFT_1374721 [Russula dissimulans]